MYKLCGQMRGGGGGYPTAPLYPKQQLNPLKAIIATVDVAV